MINNKLVLSILIVAYYFSNPIIEWRNYNKSLLEGDYSVNTDSIGLPFGLYLMVWGGGLLIIALLLWAIQKSHTKDLSLFTYNKKRPVISVIVSLFTVFLISWNIFYIFEQISEFDSINFLYAIVEIYLLMCLRIILIFYGRTTS